MSNSFPFTDVALGGGGAHGAPAPYPINKPLVMFDVIENNQGVAAGTQFAYKTTTWGGGEVGHGRKFENWNTAQNINIALECLDETPITAAHIPYTMILTVLEYPEPAGQPLNVNQIITQ